MRHFFYVGGAFDLSWIPWIAKQVGPGALRHVPLNTLTLLKDVAPYYFEWLDHPGDGPYWDFANIEGGHDRVRVPAMNLKFRPRAKRAGTPPTG